MLAWILPKNERWGNFMYWKLPQRSFFGRIQDTIICFWDLLTFSRHMNSVHRNFLQVDNINQNLCINYVTQILWKIQLAKIFFSLGRTRLNHEMGILKFKLSNCHSNVCNFLLNLRVVLNQWILGTLKSDKILWKRLFFNQGTKCLFVWFSGFEKEPYEWTWSRSF